MALIAPTIALSALLLFTVMLCLVAMTAHPTAAERSIRWATRRTLLRD